MTKLRNIYPEDIASVLCFLHVFKTTEEYFLGRTEEYLFGRQFVLPVFRVETSG